MQNISWILPEKICWFDSSETEYSTECFIRGQILSLPQSSLKLSLSYLLPNHSKKTIEVPVSKVYEINEDIPSEGIDDLVNLACFNEPELLNNLKLRYKKDCIFTYIGPTMLIINPYKTLPMDFSKETIQKYKEYTMKAEKFLLAENPPHIFANAGLAYRQLFEQNRNQAMVISGESGAGKTESVKYTMKFLAALSSKENGNILKNEMPIEEKIVNCSLILEAFGNAKTIRNYNSSRFGKYVRIWMQRRTRKIREADIINYLLEKSRVSMQSAGERNYHIFYHFLRGASQELLDKFGLTKDLKYYEYLNKSGCYDAENIDDVILFRGVCDCLDQMKFSQDEVNAIWSVLATILKLGNLEFDDAKKTDTNPCKILNEPLFDQISQLLSIDKDILRSALTIKTRITDKEKFLCPLDKSECFSVRDSFSKCLYDKVFNWMIRRLNVAIRNEEENETPNECRSIGLLDIFGFEDFKVNSLEQFCINFTNEKLQQLYINYIFKSEKREFIEEGLENCLGQISYQDNQPVIDLFDKHPFGIFLLLDESTTLKSSDDKRLLETIVKTHKDNVCFKAPKSVIETFIVCHSAKNVEYNIIGFRKKNKDEINPEIHDAVINSKNYNIYNIYIGECESEASRSLSDASRSLSLEESKEFFMGTPKRIGKSMGGQDKFLGTKFRTQMRSLMEELMSCDAHFVRCIKPNEEKKSDCFVPSTVLSQIRYLGLLDSIKVRKNTFPARKEFKDFFKKYQVLLRTKGCKDYSKEIKNHEFLFLSKEIIKVALGQFVSDSEVLYGKTKIYLKAETEDKIDRIFLKMWKEKREKALRILKQFKVYRYRTVVLERLKTLYRRMMKFRRIQAICRGKIQRRRYMRKKKGAAKLANIMKKQGLKVMRKQFDKLKRICKEIMKWQLKKKMAQQFCLLRAKVKKTQLEFFAKKYRNQAKAKTVAIERKKEYERLQKLKEEEERLKKLKGEEEKAKKIEFERQQKLKEEEEKAKKLENDRQQRMKEEAEKAKKLAEEREQMRKKQEAEAERLKKQKEEAFEKQRKEEMLKEVLQRKKDTLLKKQNEEALLTRQEQPQKDEENDKDFLTLPGQKKGSEEIMRQKSKTIDKREMEKADKLKYEFVAVRAFELKELKNTIEPIGDVKVLGKDTLAVSPGLRPKEKSFVGAIVKSDKKPAQDFKSECELKVSYNLSVNEGGAEKDNMKVPSSENIKENRRSSPTHREKVLDKAKMFEQKTQPEVTQPQPSYKVTPPEIPKEETKGNSQESSSKVLFQRTPQKNENTVTAEKQVKKSPAILLTPTKDEGKQPAEPKGSSVKEMARNLTMANLTFGRPYPGPIPKSPVPQPIIETVENNKKAEIDSSFNDMIMDRGVPAGAGKKKKPVKKTQTFDFESKEQEEAIKIIKKLPSKTIVEKSEEKATSSLIEPSKDMQKPLMQKLPSKKIIEEQEESKAKTIDPPKVLFKKPSKTITENPEENKPAKNPEISKISLLLEEIKTSQRAKATTNINISMEEKKSADKSKLIPKQNDSSDKTQKVSDVASIFEKKSTEKEKDPEQQPPNLVKVNKVSEFAANFEKNKQPEKEEKSALKPPIDSKVSVKDMTKNLSMANLTFRLPGSPMPEKPRKIESKESIDISNEEKPKKLASFTEIEGRVSTNENSMKSGRESQKDRESLKNKDLFISAIVNKVTTEPPISAKFNKEASAKVEKNALFKSELSQKIENNNETNKNLKVEQKTSVKDMAKNLSLANLQFRLPGQERPKPLPKVEETPEIEKKENPLNSDFNNMILERAGTGVGGRKKKAAKKVEDFDF